MDSSPSFANFNPLNTYRVLANHNLLHDRDSNYCSSFRQIIEAGSVKPLALPPRSPNLNAYAERWVRSVKEECLAKLILLVKAHCGARCATTKPPTTTLHNAHFAMSLKSWCWTSAG